MSSAPNNRSLPLPQGVDPNSLPQLPSGIQLPFGIGNIPPSPTSYLGNDAFTQSLIYNPNSGEDFNTFRRRLMQQGGGQNMPPPSPKMPVRNLPGMPQFNPNAKASDLQMPSQAQLGQIGGNITDLINRAIASKQLLNQNSQT